MVKRGRSKKEAVLCYLSSRENLGKELLFPGFSSASGRSEKGGPFFDLAVSLLFLLLMMLLMV